MEQLLLPVLNPQREYDEGSEGALKREPLQDFKVLHFAVHGILSTKSPTRSALLLNPSPSEDGLLQAWEILNFRLRAELVTLSACDTGTGVVHGQGRTRQHPVNGRRHAFHSATP